MTTTVHFTHKQHYTGLDANAPFSVMTDTVSVASSCSGAILGLPRVALGRLMLHVSGPEMTGTLYKSATR